MFLMLMPFACVASSAQTLSAADKLYAQGVAYMKTMTVTSQNQAIATFKKAKVAYDSSVRKRLCDDMVTICNGIIKKLHAPAPKAKPVIVRDTIYITPDTAMVPPPVVASISISPAFIEFSAKGGTYEEINVECTSDDWVIVECPKWLSYTTANGKILVKAEKNKEKAERAGIIKMACSSQQAEVLVKQLK